MLRYVVGMEAEPGVSRLEGFSDAVFGFAVTLLVVSLEVPAKFDDLIAILRRLPVFAITFALLLLIWQEQHRFFRKFPIADGVTIWLNGGLLFTVMVYIYPLKFLFAVVAGPQGWASARQALRPGQIVDAMVLYGAGFMSIFVMLAALYGHAWRRSRRSRLVQKQAEAVEGVWHCLISVVVGAISIAISAIGGPRATGVAGFSYVLIAPFHFLHHRLFRHRRLR
jgi:uncharacterized membrane protein